jgi:hypothetical protein
MANEVSVSSVSTQKMVTIATDQINCYNLGVSTTLKNIQEVFR